MIHLPVFANLGEFVNIYQNGAKWPAKPTTLYPWVELKKVMENTDDHIVWIITTQQLNAFLHRIKAEDLEKYLVVAHRDIVNSGTSNRNYPQDNMKRKLKVFIMKGVGK